MLSNNETLAPLSGYNHGSEMWRDNASSYGIDEAIIITRNYLDLNLKREHSDEEGQFCLELFAEMFHATASRTDVSKIVYPYDLENADKRLETSYYYLSRMKNTECARGIDLLIKDSCYKTNYYNLKIAAMRAILEYGFQRICHVLAFNYQNNTSDGRLSSANRCWTNEFSVCEKAFNDAWLHSHPITVDGFCKYIRELYQSLDAERFALPGNEEHGEYIRGYEIKRAIITSDDEGFSTGYAIGRNPEAMQRWVCWQFAIRDGERSYNLGIYCDDEQTSIDAYNARVFVALS